MKENEAISRMRYRVETATHNIGKGVDGKAYEDMEMAIKALEGIQQYRAIGTVEECQEARERQSEKKPNKRQVGTNILMTKIYYCPICNKKLYDCAIKNGKLDYVSPGSKKRKFCEDCGQKLDWSE